jgi:hypothetical protein
MTAQRLIYPDTNIWSYLAQLPVDEAKLIQGLADKNATLVLSAHTVYELARTFTGKSGTDVGVSLFSSLKRFLEAGLACSIEFRQMIIRECHAMENQLGEINTLLDVDDAAVVASEVSKLADGKAEQIVEDFIKKRTKEATDTRADQRSHFDNRDELKRKLKAVAPGDLSAWLDSEVMSSSGSEILFQHLKRILGVGPTPEYASAVLHYPTSHACRALVRGDLYSNWRAGNRGSNPADLLDDMVHVLQAIYSDVYVTADTKQTEYASLLLTSRTTVVIYDRSVAVNDYLVRIV